MVPPIRYKNSSKTDAKAPNLQFISYDSLEQGKNAIRITDIHRMHEQKIENNTSSFDMMFDQFVG